MNIRMARRCLNGGCQEAIQCPEGRCALHAAMHAPVPRNEGPEERVAPKVSEKDINRWQDTIQQRPEGPWTLGCGGSFDRTTINPISDEMLAELAQWLRMGYTPWNGRSMPLSPGDRQFMFMLYYSVQGLIARVRAAEKTAAADGWHSVAVDGLPPCDGETVYLGQNDAGYLCTFTRVNPDGCCVQGTAEAVTAQFSCLTWWRVADRPGRAPTDSQAGRDAVEAFTDRQCLLLSFAIRFGVEGVEPVVDLFIEHGAKCVVEKAISEVRAALSTTTGRAAE